MVNGSSSGMLRQATSMRGAPEVRRLQIRHSKWSAKGSLSRSSRGSLINRYVNRFKRTGRPQLSSTGPSDSALVTRAVSPQYALVWQSLRRQVFWFPKAGYDLGIKILLSQALLWPYAIGFGEDLIEFRIAAEACRKRRLCKSLRIWSPVLFEEARESQGVSVLGHGKPYLTMKHPTQIGLAGAADLRQLGETDLRGVLTQCLNSTAYTRMQRDSLLD